MAAALAKISAHLRISENGARNFCIAVRHEFKGLQPPFEMIAACVTRAATMVERREVVMSLITRVVCDPDRNRLVTITPKPVFAPFFRHQAGLRDVGDRVLEFVDRP
jgi:hypothetical protein